MKLAALLFDVDGTLVDTEELHRQAYNQTFLEFGFGWEWGVNLYAELLAVSGGVERLARYIDLIDLSPAEKTRVRRIIPNIHREKTLLYGELIGGKSVRLRPGVARLIDEARRCGLRIGFAASSASATVQPLVSAAFNQKFSRSGGRDRMRGAGRAKKTSARSLRISSDYAPCPCRCECRVRRFR